MHVLFDAVIDEGKPSGDSGEPVEETVRTVDRSWLSIGLSPDFLSVSMNFAEVPNQVILSASA